MLMGMIARLQVRIDELESRMSSQPVPAPAPTTALAPLFHPRKEDEPSEYSEYSEYSESPEAVESAPSVPQTLEDQEREAIRSALARNGGHRKAAADELKISQRTLYRKIKDYGLE